MVDRFLAWLAELPPLAVYASLAAVSAVENVFPPVPADVAVLLGAFLSTRGLTSAPLIGLVCWLANTASSAAVYFLARAKGEAFFQSGWRKKLLPPESRQALHEAYRKHGVLGIFLSRFLPGVRAAVTPFAGVAGMPPLKVLVPAASASAIWYAALVVVGSALGLQWERAKDIVSDANRVLGLVSLAVVVAIAFWLRRSRTRARKA